MRGTTLSTNYPWHLRSLCSPGAFWSMGTRLRGRGNCSLLKIPSNGGLTTSLKLSPVLLKCGFRSVHFTSRPTAAASKYITTCNDRLWDRILLVHHVHSSPLNREEYAIDENNLLQHRVIQSTCIERCKSNHFTQAPITPNFPFSFNCEIAAEDYIEK